MLIFVSVFTLASDWNANGLLRVDSATGIVREGEVAIAFGYDLPSERDFYHPADLNGIDDFAFYVDRKPFWYGHRAE